MAPTSPYFDTADPTAILDLSLILGPHRLNTQGRGVNASAKKPNSEQPQPGPSFSITGCSCQTLLRWKGRGLTYFVE